MLSLNSATNLSISQLKFRKQVCVISSLTLKTYLSHFEVEVNDGGVDEADAAAGGEAIMKLKNLPRSNANL